jgi:hypothetical protein
MTSRGHRHQSRNQRFGGVRLAENRLLGGHVLFGQSDRTIYDDILTGGQRLRAGAGHLWFQAIR